MTRCEGAEVDKDFYDNEDAIWTPRDYRGYVLPYITAWYGAVRPMLPPKAALLELGAGTCTTALTVSKEDFVGEIVVSDISAKRMKGLSMRTNELVQGDISRLSFVESNFNDPLPFPDDRFDLVVMDAALHHSRNVWVTLAEVRRVLKPGGVFVAQREAFTSPLTHWITFDRLLASPEAAAGVSENAYLKSQYDYYLRVNGFEPRFMPVLTNWKFKLLRFANGWLFSKYNIVSRSTRRAPA